MAKIRILIVDDERYARFGLSACLATAPDIEVIGEAANGYEAIAQCKQLEPDVVLMDIVMPKMDGVEATQRLCAGYGDRIKILILSTADDDELVAQALRNGAAGYLSKVTPPEDLAFAIQAVYKGYTHLGPGLGRKILAQIPDPVLTSAVTWERLTLREQEILKLLAQGASNAEIAKQLCIAVQTVKNHVSSILHQLNLDNRTQAAIFAYLQLTRS